MTGDLSFVTNEAGIGHPVLELEDELSDSLQLPLAWASATWESGSQLPQP